MKTRPLAFALLLSLAPTAALPPRAAYAQGGDEATTKMARQRFQEGVSYYDKGQYEMARAAFLQAYALRKHPAVLMNLAQSCLKSGHALDAARYFQQFLKEYSGATEAQRNDANRGLGEARMKLGRIDVIGATVGADVFVDDERIGMAPLDHSVDVEPGTHTVRSQGPNGEQSIQVTAQMGQGAVAKFSASATAAPPPPQSAAAPPAEPPSEPPAAPPFEPNPPPTSPPPPPADQASEGSHPWGWVIATGLVTVGGFAVAGGMAKAKSDAQSSADAVASSIIAHGGGRGTCYPPVQPPFTDACSALSTDNNNVNADATVANIAAGVGIVGGVGLILSIIFTAKSYGHGSTAQAAPPITVAPLVGKGLGGMSVGGTF
jgi:hypothetical protein